MILNILSLRCPHCGKGSIANGLFRTAKHCPKCQVLLESESGFYAGAIYPLYGMAAVVGGLVSLSGLLIFDWGAGLSVGLGCLAVALSSPYLFWLSRSAFLHAEKKFFKRLGD